MNGREHYLLPSTLSPASIMRCGGHLRRLICTACIGGFLFGYDTGVISGAMLQLKASPTLYPVAGGFGLTNFQQEVVVSSAIAGAILGAIVAGSCAERFGRRPTLLGAAILFTAGALVMAVAPSFLVVVVGRVAVGMSVGVSSTVVPIYIAEAAPARVRGKLTVLNNVMVVLGQVCAALTSCALSSARTPHGWRYMLGLGAAPAIAMCAGMSQLPESPRWLAARALAVGDTEARGALAVLRLLRDDGTGREGRCAGTTAGPDTAADAGDCGGDDDVERELDDIRADLAAGAVAGGDRAVGLGAALSDPRVRAALVLGCVLQLAQQLTGINTLMYYSATILQVSQTTEAEPDPFAESSERAVCLSAATATAQMVGNFIGMGLVERSGRRTLTLWSLGAVSASLVLLGFAFHGTGSTALAVASMIAYLLAFGIGLAPMPWTVNAEIYPIRVRSLCVSIATGVNWAANFLVSLTFLSLGEALSSDREDAKHHPDGVFWLFSGIGVACWCWLYRRMPETKGLSLEAIGQLFEPAQNVGRSGVCRCWCWPSGDSKSGYESVDQH